MKLLVCGLATATTLALVLAFNHRPQATPPLHPPLPQITHTGSSGIPVVIKTPGGPLIVSYVIAVESFQLKSTLTWLGKLFGTTISTVRVPAHYQYQVQTAKEWRAYMRDDKFLVIAPQVEFSLPVAIDTAKIEMHTESGWLRFDKGENLQALLRDISPQLAARAGYKDYVELQHETARKAVADFATKWLITQEKWKAVKPEQIKVYFSDEKIEKLRTALEEFTGD